MKTIRGVLLDLDGTIYLGDRVFPYTQTFLDLMDSLGIKHLFLTNNSSKSTEAYIDKFAKMGIYADDSNILISSHAAADYLHRTYPGARTFVLGTESMRKEMQSLGITVVDDEPDVVLAAFDTSLCYDRLTKFCNFVAQGKPYVATHPDLVCPAPVGFLPDLGGLMALIRAVTGRDPEVVCGKPNEQILIAAEHKLGLGRSELVMIGDRLMTDIAIGQHGVRTCLVLSGEAKREDVENAPVKPTWIFDNILAFGEAIRAEKQK